MSNPHSFTLKKWFATLLKNKYEQEDNVIVERIASALSTERDVEDFGKLMGKLFEGGYRRAVKDMEGQMKEHGLTVDIKTTVVKPEDV